MIRKNQLGFFFGLRMTNEDMQILREQRLLLDAARIRHKREIALLEQSIRDIEKTCDHKYPTGETAWEGYFMYSSCDICGVSDL